MPNSFSAQSASESIGPVLPWVHPAPPQGTATRSTSIVALPLPRAWWLGTHGPAGALAPVAATVVAAYVQRMCGAGDTVLAVGLPPARSGGEDPAWRTCAVPPLDDLSLTGGATTLAKALQAAAPAGPSQTSRMHAGLAMVESLDAATTLTGAPALTVVIEDGGARCGLLVDATRVSERDGRRMAGHLATLFHAAAAEPARRLGELELLTREERTLLVDTWNDTAQDYPRASTVHALIAAQAARVPDAPALIARGGGLSHGELREAVVRWSAVLRGLGVGPDVLVGVRMRRTPEMVIAILAIMEAGGAYVPIDPGWPAERMRFVLDDAAIHLVLSTSDLTDAIIESRDREVRRLDLDRDPPAIAGSPAADGATTTSEHLAYVIYTSGSTGTPKGVLVEHRGVVNYLTWCIRAYEADRGIGSPMHSSLAFDLTVTSVLAPLAAGGAVVLVHDDEGVEGLAAALRAHRDFSLVKLTPAHLDLLRVQLDPDEIAGCARRLVVGGEALHGRSLEFLRRSAPEMRIVNEYGPTETVVGCCVHELRAADAVPEVVPIGRPIANTQLHVLDPMGRLLPVGVAGELYIGGDGVARGYLNRPELTAERFVPDPFAPERGRRLYRTGDRVRRLADGSLEFLGRFDDQVKLQGHRVELGEVEHAVRAHPAVREAAAAVRELVPGAPQLVVWAVPERGSRLDDAELTAWVAQRLPAYMVPAAWVSLASMPLTRNGKVDRAALPMPAPRAARRNASAAVEARTSLERELLQIWRELLGASVGITDDFFANGGTSLLAARLVRAAQRRTGKKVGFSTLLAAPTVERLARRLAQRQEDADAAEDAPIVQLRRGRAGVPPFHYFHGSLGFHSVELARHFHPDQPFYSVHPVGVGGPDTVEGMAELRVRQLREVQPHGPYQLGGLCNGAALAFEVARRLREAGEEVGLLALINAHDRTAGLRPLRRAASVLARAARLSPERERDLWLRLRARATWILPQLPHLGPSAGLGTKFRFAAAIPAYLARVIARRLRGRHVSDVPSRTAPHDGDDRPIALADGDDGAAHYNFVDVALTTWFPDRYDGHATLIFWEQSFALRDDDGLHREDASRGWVRHCGSVEIRTLPGDGNDVDARDKGALGRELMALLRAEHARRGIVLGATHSRSKSDAA